MNDKIDWNSEEKLIGDITCNQASRIMTCYISVLRACTMASIIAEQENKNATLAGVRTIIAVLDTIATSMENNMMTPEQRAAAEDNLPIMMIAAGESLSALASISEGKLLGQLADHATDLLISTVEKLGPEKIDNNYIEVDVAKNHSDQDILARVRLVAVDDIINKHLSNVENAGEFIKLLKKKLGAQDI